jgi:integrase
MNITTRPLLTDELVSLIFGVQQPWKSIYFLAAYTGLRVSDLMDLPWQAQPPLAPVLEHKTNKRKFLAWTTLALGYWSALYEFGEPRTYLCPPRDPSTYRKAIQRDCAALGIPTSRVAFHSLRKTHAVIAFNEGGLLHAKSTMNHSSLATTEKYIETALRFDTGRAFDKYFIDGVTPQLNKGPDPR